VRRGMKRVICVGNRYHPEDAAGPLVYDRLALLERPADVEVIDGVLGGLDLLRFVEGAARVVFVDAAWGCETPGGLLLLAGDEVERQAPTAYGHMAGLAYLLGVVRHVLDGPVPEIFVLGIAGAPQRATIEAAARLGLEIASHGRRVEQRRSLARLGVRS